MRNYLNKHIKTANFYSKYHIIYILLLALECQSLYGTLNAYYTRALEMVPLLPVCRE